MMAEKNTLLAELHETLSALVSNAEELCKVSREAVSGDLLDPLQEEQEKLVNKVKAYDEQITKAYPKGDVAERFSRQWKAIVKQLHDFEALNEEFFNNLTVRKELISFEMKDIKKQRRDLVQLKEAYTAESGKGKTRRINTTQ